MGQGAKDIGGEVASHPGTGVAAEELGYIVLPDPEDPGHSGGLPAGDFKEFERHSRLGMVDEEDFHKRSTT
jgi:hypothetical protein